MRVQETAALPAMNQTGEIEQLDRFAEYGPADMWYAEPLGLARWKRVECHAMIVRDPGAVFKFHTDFGPTVNPRPGVHYGFSP